MKRGHKRKICFPISNRAYYSRRELLLNLLKKHPVFELQIVMGGSVLLEKYSGRLYQEIASRGFDISATLLNIVEGGNAAAMAKTAGLTALDFANTFVQIQPEMVIIDGDRFEQLAVAMAAAYLNKILVHIEGGDLSGNIDESVRHAITKLSHIHLVTNQDSYHRVIKMGENPKYVFNVGSLDIEYASMINKKISRDFLDAYGAGKSIDVAKPFLMAVYHPVTSDPENRRHVEMILQVLKNLQMPVVWFWPNPDAGTNEVAEVIRHFREHLNSPNGCFHFITNLPGEDFIALLKKTKCLIGNSSVGIKECSYLGVPVVNIGERQKGRLRGKNLIDVGYDSASLKKTIQKQIQHGPYQPEFIYFQPNTSRKIIQILNRVKPPLQKQFYES